MGMRRRLFNNEVDIEKLAKNTQFGRDIDCPITNKDFQDALKNTSKSVSTKDLDGFEKWTNEFKSL